MAYSPSYAVELQKRHKTTFWRIYDRAGKYMLDSNETDNGLEDSVEKLQETLNNLLADFVKVKLYSKKPEQNESGKSAVKIWEFEVKTGKAPTNNNYMAGAPSWQDFMNLTKEMMSLQIENNKLKTESENKNTENNDKWLELAYSFAPHIINYITKNKKNTPTMKEAISQPQENNNNIVNEFFNVIKRIDPEGAEKTLKRLTLAINANNKYYWDTKKELDEAFGD